MGFAYTYFWARAGRCLNWTPFTLNPNATSTAKLTPTLQSLGISGIVNGVLVIGDIGLPVSQSRDSGFRAWALPVLCQKMYYILKLRSSTCSLLHKGPGRTQRSI